MTESYMPRFPKPTEKDIFEGELEPDPEPFQDLEDDQGNQDDLGSQLADL